MYDLLSNTMNEMYLITIWWFYVKQDRKTTTTKSLYKLNTLLNVWGINVSTELLKWRPMPDKMREFTLRHNVQRHLGQSEDWII